MKLIRSSFYTVHSSSFCCTYHFLPHLCNVKTKQRFLFDLGLQAFCNSYKFFDILIHTYHIGATAGNDLTNTRTTIEVALIGQRCESLLHGAYVPCLQ